MLEELMAQSKALQEDIKIKEQKIASAKHYQLLIGKHMNTLGNEQHVYQCANDTVNAKLKWENISLCMAEDSKVSAKIRGLYDKNHKKEKELKILQKKIDAILDEEVSAPLLSFFGIFESEKHNEGLTVAVSENNQLCKL